MRCEWEKGGVRSGWEGEEVRDGWVKCGVS